MATEENGTVSYKYHDTLGSTIETQTTGTQQSYTYSAFGSDEVVVDDFSYTDSPLNHGWANYTGYAGTVSSAYDSTVNNQVMVVQSSNDTNFGIAYGYPQNPLSVKRTGLSFKYRATKKMNVYVRVRGKNGTEYYITYMIGTDGTPSVSGSYYYIRLGSATIDGKWRLLERDIQNDLKAGFNVELDQVRWFCIRGGEYSLDDLWLSGEDLGSNMRKYADQDQDRTGLYFLRRRYYDSELGRFISPDTYHGSIYDPLTLNRYIYARNNPILYKDPSGNDFILYNDSAAVAGFGHNAALIGNENNKFFHYTHNINSGAVCNGKASYGTISKFKSSGWGNRYDRSVHFQTTPQVDEDMKKKASELITKKFNIFSNNCATVTEKTAQAGGFNIKARIFWVAHPNKQYHVANQSPDKL